MPCCPIQVWIAIYNTIIAFLSLAFLDNEDAHPFAVIALASVCVVTLCFFTTIGTTATPIAPTTLKIQTNGGSSARTFATFDMQPRDVDFALDDYRGGQFVCGVCGGCGLKQALSYIFSVCLNQFACKFEFIKLASNESSIFRNKMSSARSMSLPVGAIPASSWLSTQRHQSMTYQYAFYPRWMLRDAT